MVHLQASSFDKISPTALMVAYARQFSDIPYSKELSQLVNAEAVFEQLEIAAEQLHQQKLGRPFELAVLLEARYKAINQLMAQFKTTQIIELASGLLPRGMIVSQDSSNIFIESDLPAMINRKQQLVKQLIGDRSNLYFVPINAASQPSQFPVNADYLDSQKPITVICEGLLMYLTLAQKQQVFTNVRELLQTYGGVWITSDLATKEDLSKRWKNSPTWLKFQQAVNQMTGMSAKDTRFDNLEQVRQFAAEQGFDIQSYTMLNVLDRLTCVQPLGIDPAVAKSLLANLPVFALSLCDS